MKVTERFMRFYEDVLLGKVTLDRAQVLFCGGDDKNRWYNLKSRLKDEVKAMETKYGKTEKEISKWTEMNYTMSNLFLYVYEKILTGEIDVKEGQAFISGDNLTKWYNLKAKEKAGVEMLEHKHKKTLKYGKVVDLATETKKGDIKMNKTKGIRMAAAQGAVDNKEQGKKPRKVVNESAPHIGNRKEIAGYPSVKAYFISIYEEVAQGKLTESEGRAKFEGTENVKGKWNNYKYVTAAEDVKAIKKKYDVSSTAKKSVKEDDKKFEKSVKTPKISAQTEEKGSDGETIPSTSKGASKGNSERPKASAPKTAKNKGLKKGAKNTKEHETKEVETTPKKEKKPEVGIKITGKTKEAKTGEPVVHKEEKASKLSRPMLGFPSIKACFLHLVEEVEKGNKTLAEAKTEFEGVEGINVKWCNYKCNLKSAVQEIKDRVHNDKKETEMSPSSVPSTKDTLFGMQSVGEVVRVNEQEKQSVLQKLGVMNIQSLAVGDSVILPTKAEQNIKEIRAKLLEELDAGRITKERMVEEGQFENIEILNVWLKRKHGQTLNVSDESIDETDESTLLHKGKAIVNPNDEVEETGDKAEELAEDYIGDYEEDYSSYDEDESVENENSTDISANVINEESVKVKNKSDDYVTDSAQKSVIHMGENLHRLMEEVRAEKKEEHSDECPYNCVNGKVFLASRGYVPCPHCMGIEKKVQMLDDSNNVNIYKLLKIPRQYKDIINVPDDVLKGLHDKVYVSSSIAEVKSLLNTMVQAVRRSSVASISTYVHVSNYVDIRPFIYGLQREAVENGVGTVPYISLNTLAALLYASNAAADGDIEMDAKLNTERLALGNIAYTTNAFRRLAVDFPCDYYDYCKAPMVILEATAETLSRGWSALADLLSERAREGLPTYVFGYNASNSPNVVKDLKWLISDNMNRLDMLTVVELKKASKIGEGYPTRSFNSIEDTDGDTGTGIRVVSMIEHEPQVDVKKARDVFMGKYGNS